MPMTVEEILARAKEAGASDVHITVGIPPKMRVNGDLLTMEGDRLMPADTLEIAAQVMNEKQQQRFEENGECDMSFAIAGQGRYRVNIYKQRGSIAMAFRLVDTKVPSAESLGVPQSVIDLYQKKRGLVLVTGPTGSGKSTTLASLIDKINNNREAHVITLEDPIEYLHSHNRSIVNQREIGLDSLSYAHALRAALREDPDVILVGEMRDFETISVAITAAETGHLVISTLHTVGAANTIDRIIDSFPPAQQEQVRAQLSMVMQAVVSQQLIPKVEGGVVPAFEVMFFNNAIRNLIRESKIHQIDNIIATSQEEGMITMDNSLIKLFKDGKISRENAVIYSSNGELMEKKLARL